MIPIQTTSENDSFAIIIKKDPTPMCFAYPFIDWCGNSEFDIFDGFCYSENVELKKATYTLFCSHIVVNIMELDANVIQVRCLASFKTRFNPPFSTHENVCAKSGIGQLLSIRLMCLSF